MKAKIRGSGFRGVLDNVFDSGSRATGTKKPEVVSGNMGWDNAGNLAHEFSAALRQRPDIKRPVWHCFLSLPEGERLDAERWGEVTEAFIKSMGFGESRQYVGVRHEDTEFAHVHIVASRVGLAWPGRDSLAWPLGGLRGDRGYAGA
jgi:hypothetical protein